MSLQPHTMRCPRCSHPMSATSPAALQVTEFEHAAYCVQPKGIRE